MSASIRDTMPITGRMLAIDIETTGVDQKRDRIVEIGLAWSGGGRARWLVNPMRHIPVEAAALHGIRNDDVAMAPTFGAVCGEVLDRLAKARAAGYEVVTYNGGSLDVPMLTAEFLACGVGPHVHHLDEHVDVLPWVRTQKLPGGHSLSNAARHCGVAVGNHHADADAEATLKIAERLIACGEMPNAFGQAQRGPVKE